MADIFHPEAAGKNWLAIENRGPDTPPRVVISQGFYKELVGKAKQMKGFAGTVRNAYADALRDMGFSHSAANDFYKNFSGKTDTFENAEAARTAIDAALSKGDPDAFSKGLQTQYADFLKPHMDAFTAGKSKYATGPNAASHVGLKLYENYGVTGAGKQAVEKALAAKGDLDQAALRGAVAPAVPRQSEEGVTATSKSRIEDAFGMFPATAPSGETVPAADAPTVNQQAKGDRARRAGGPSVIPPPRA